MHPMTVTNNDIRPMERALELARSAVLNGEVPVGAVILHNGKIIAESHNTKETKSLATGHAEIEVINRASKILGTWRLNDCCLYVSLEPCLMCAGAIIQARIGEVIFAAKDPKAGAVCSLYNLFDDNRLNHNPKWSCGELSKESSKLLKDFFNTKRIEKSEKKNRG
jgi:tRNA(adenine34) deaminase